MLAKRVFKNVNTKKLSAVPADPYGDRFIDFMRNSVFEKPRDADSDNLLKRMISQAIMEQFRQINSMKLNDMGLKLFKKKKENE